jgi:PAS domain-containing protein
MQSPDEIGDLAGAFNFMADGVTVLDPVGRVLLFNRVAEETFGCTAEEAQGRMLLEIALHPELDRLVSVALTSGVQGSSEIQLRRPVFRILRVFVTPMLGEGPPPPRGPDLPGFDRAAPPGKRPPGFCDQRRPRAEDPPRHDGRDGGKP